MTRLREALKDIAEEAPLVSLADAAITGHRRRRKARLAVTAVATVAALVAGSAATAVSWPRTAQTATPQRTETVPDLPGGRVEPLSHGYLTPCNNDQKRRIIDCSVQEWRVVTRGGTTYRVPQALVGTDKGQVVPIAVSRDGRMLAYYSRQAQAHVVRDLATGTETTSPVTVKEERIQMGNQLVVSDDGRYVAFDPRVGSKQPGLLIDVRTGKTVPIPGVYEPISIKDGVVELVRYRKTDIWLMPVTGGGKPVRFDGAYIFFSEIAPDGRTMVAHYFKDEAKPTLTVLDTKTGRALRKVTIRGLPDPRGYFQPSIWLSQSEVVVLGQGYKLDQSTYAVNVNTGKARHLADYPSKTVRDLILPGTASGK
ncbi:hypothetical protein [Nonomuraea sp. NPDC049695]|uniref:hypothetical protein n=1 Tax=Nonomuraea sp. NPDC049695 TaxID=3154734 RepID=UPI00342906DC